MALDPEIPFESFGSEPVVAPDGPEPSGGGGISRMLARRTPEQRAAARARLLLEAEAARREGDRLDGVPMPGELEARLAQSDSVPARLLSAGLRARRLQDELWERFIAGGADVLAGGAAEFGRVAERLNRIIPLEAQENFTARREEGEGLQGAADVVRGALPMPAAATDRNVLERFVAEDLPAGAGNLAAFVGTGLLAGPAAATTLGVASGAEGAAREAEAKGATPGQVAVNETLGGALGALDAIIPGDFRGATGPVRRALAGTLTEGGTEAIQQAGGNVAAKLTYDPERKVSEGVARSAAVGAVLGAGAGGARGLADRPPAAPVPAVPAPAPEAPEAPRLADSMRARRRAERVSAAAPDAPDWTLGAPDDAAVRRLGESWLAAGQDDDAFTLPPLPPPEVKGLPAIAAALDPNLKAVQGRGMVALDSRRTPDPGEVLALVGQDGRPVNATYVAKTPDGHVLRPGRAWKDGAAPDGTVTVAEDRFHGPLAVLAYQESPDRWFVDSSESEESRALQARNVRRPGTPAYQAIYGWAARNGLQVVPDSETSPDGVLRRNAHALSSVARTGTAAHVAPAPQQLRLMYPEEFAPAALVNPLAEPDTGWAGRPDFARALARWAREDTAGRAGRLALAEARVTGLAQPDLLRYRGFDEYRRRPAAPADARATVPQPGGTGTLPQPDAAQARGVRAPERIGGRTARRHFATRSLLEQARNERRQPGRRGAGPDVLTPAARQEILYAGTAAPPVLPALPPQLDTAVRAAPTAPAQIVIQPDGALEMVLDPSFYALPATQQQAVLDEETRHAALLRYTVELLRSRGFTGDFGRGAMLLLEDHLNLFTAEQQAKFTEGLATIYGRADLSPGQKLAEIFRLASQAKAGLDFTEQATRPGALARFLDFVRGFRDWLLATFNDPAQMPDPVRELFEGAERMLQSAPQAAPAANPSILYAARPDDGRAFFPGPPTPTTDAQASDQTAAPPPALAGQPAQAGPEAEVPAGTAPAEGPRALQVPGVPDAAAVAARLAALRGRLPRAEADALDSWAELLRRAAAVPELAAALAAGTPPPNLRDLARQAGVGEDSVREAMRDPNVRAVMAPPAPVFPAAPPVPPVLAPPPPSGVRQMVFAAEDAVVLDDFTRADGSPQPAVRIRSGPSYDRALLDDLLRWTTEAEAALAAGNNDPETTAGLQAGLAEARALVSERWLPDQIADATLGPGPAAALMRRLPAFALKSVLARLAPGPWGQRIARAASIFERAGARADGIFKAEAGRHADLTRAALKSLNLDPADASTQVIFQSAWNETAHRLRQFQSGVLPGDLLLNSREAIRRGLRVTPELLALARNERLDVFQKVQDFVQALPWGGIRENIGGRRIIRPPRPTGDLGLARLPDRASITALADAMRAARDAGTPRPDALAAFFDANPDALTAHVLDASRTDIAGAREAVLGPAVSALAADLRAGHTTPPDSVADLVRLLAAKGVPAPDAEAALLRELDQYAVRAQAFVDADSITDPATGETTVGHIDEASEFTKPAAPLQFPGNWYSYGSGATGTGGLRSSIENVTRPARLDLAIAVRQAADHLDVLARAVRAAVDGAPLARAQRAEAAAVLGRRFKLDSPDALAQAASALSTRAGQLRDGGARILNPPRPAAPNVLNQTLNRIIAAWLAAPSAAILNIVGGPVAAFDSTAPLLGGWRAALLTLRLIAQSPFALTGQALRTVVPDAWLDSLASKFGLPAAEANAIQEELRASSMPPIEGVNVEAGTYEGPVVRGLRRAGARRMANVLAGRPVSRAVSRLSRAVGVEAGDAALNRAINTTAIPAVIRHLKGVARAWQDAGRPAVLAPEQAGGPREAAYIAEMAGELGMAEADFLDAVAAMPPDGAGILNDPLGRRIAFREATRMNVATALNRPDPNWFLSLKGWSTQRLMALADLFRGTAGETQMQALRRNAVPALAAPITLGLAYFASKEAAWGADAAWNKALAELKELLGAPPDDDDEGLAAWLERVAHKLLDLLRASPQKDLLPHSPAFWAQPTGTLLLSALNAVAGATGWDLKSIYSGEMASRIPALSVAGSLAKTLAHFGRGTLALAQGRPAAARADFRAGTGQTLRLGGPVGRVAARVVAGPEASGQVENFIRNAAQEEGIKVNEFQAGGGLLSGSPNLRREMLVAGAMARNPATRDAAVATLRQIQTEAYNVAAERVIKRGGSEREAAQAGRAAVQRLIGSLDPVQNAVGRALSREEYAKLAPRLEGNAAIANQRAAAESAARTLAASPAPNLPRPTVSAAALSPVKSGGGSGAASRRPRSSRGRRRTLLGRARTRRPRRVRLRRPRRKKARRRA